ncbi:uncharacterized protein LOC120678372 isoform X3 [Panicum virgatum]|uniref:uncharacterized protein LOC120678372 isoform X3 n=1 Tax=Panicum virgatum TaxID=38727 RepID=UPI0019D50855|nr:uncharacterized protein LOC120678372 isoform X3 [Panicum virgatum]
MAGTGPIRQDWELVEKDEKAVNAECRSGAEIETTKKYNAGSNEAASSGTSLDTKRLDDDTENLARPSEDAVIDDWARDAAEPMFVDSGAAHAEVAAVDPTVNAPSSSAAEGVKEIQSSLQSLKLKAHVAAQDALEVEDEVEDTKRHLNVVFIGHVGRLGEQLHDENVRII